MNDVAMEFIDLCAQLEKMRPAIEKRISKVLDHGKFILGPEVLELEILLADYVGRKHCITCANGTDALQMALMCNGVGPGDIVLTPAFSFFATAEVVPQVGAKPYFVDVDRSTFNICPESVLLALDDIKSQNLGMPKAIIAVDLFGLPANFVELERICKDKGLILIEDAAQGFGGSIMGRRACSFGDVSTTSFFPAKPLGCYGDGGALFTDSDVIAERARSIRTHGAGKHKYEHVRLGLNSRLDTLQAAILLAKFEYFAAELAHRQQVSERYKDACKRVTAPFVPEGYTSGWAQYTVLAKPGERDAIRERLYARGVPTAIYYPRPLNKQTALTDFIEGDVPVANDLSNRVFSLPIGGVQKLHDVTKVVDEVRNL